VKNVVNTTQALGKDGGDDPGATTFNVDEGGAKAHCLYWTKTLSEEGEATVSLKGMATTVLMARMALLYSQWRSPLL